MRVIVGLLLGCQLLVCIGSRAEIMLTPCPDSIGAYPLSVSERYTTNLIFPVAIFQADLGDGDIIGKKMGKAENVLLLKANRAHFLPTNVSVYLVNGALYSFRITYAESLSVFNYSFRKESAVVADSPRREEPVVLFSKVAVNTERLQKDAALVLSVPGSRPAHASSRKIKIRLKAVCLNDQLLWVTFRARNKSVIDFCPGLVRFSVQDRKRVRRTAVQSIAVEPVYPPKAECLSGGSQQDWAAGFVPFTVASGKRLVLDWAETGGGRRVQLVIKGKELEKVIRCN